MENKKPEPVLASDQFDNQNKKLTNKVLKEQLKEFKKNRGKGKDVSGGPFNRQSIRNMNAMTRKGTAEFTPETQTAMGAAVGGVKAFKDEKVEGAITSIPLIGGFLNQRRLLKKTKDKQRDEREALLEMFNAVAAKNKAGAAKFQEAAKKSIKNFDNEALTDILIQMGLTTEGEIESALKLFSSEQYDLSTLQSAIENDASAAGLETKTGKLGLQLGMKSEGSLSAVKPNTPDLNDPMALAAMAVAGRGGGGGGGGVGGNSSGIESLIVMGNAVLLSIDEKIENIEKLLKPDKLQEKEDKLETDRESKLSSSLEKKSKRKGSGQGDDEEGGGFLDTVMDMMMMGSMGRRGGGRGGRPKPRRGARSRLRRMRGGKGGLIRKALTTGAKFTGLAAAGTAIGGGLSAAGNAGGGVLSSIGNFFKGAGNSVGNFAKSLNPMTAIKTATPKILKTVARKIPVLGTAFETLFSGMEISDIKSNPNLTKDEKKQQIGRVIGSSLGAILGLVGAGALTAPLAATGIGAVGTILASVAGAEAGRWLGGKASDWVGPENLYSIFSSLPLLGDMIKVDDGFDGMNSSGDMSAGLSSGASTNSSTLSPNTNTQSLAANNLGPVSVASSSISTAESTRVRNAGSGGGNNNSVVAPTINSGNSSTMNTTVNGSRVGNNEPTAAMSNAIAKYRGFSSPRMG